MSESKYNEAYIKGINKGKELAYLEMTMNCADELQFIPLSVLDKIRAEITAISIRGMVDEHTMFVRSAEQVKQMALEIIDKHIEEMRGEMNGHLSS